MKFNEKTELGGNLMILGLHQAQITIPKGAEEEGRQFYCKILGLSEVEKLGPLKGRGGFGWKLVINKYMLGQKMILIEQKQRHI